LTFKKAATKIKAGSWLDELKIAQFSLIKYLSQSEPDAGDLNEREWILRVGVVSVYPTAGIISLIRA